MSTEQQLRALSRTQFTIAQACLGCVFAAEVVAVVVGVRGAAMESWEAWATFWLVALALASGFSRRLGDHFAGSANEIRCLLDLRDGLGRPIEPLKAADLIAGTSVVVQRLASRKEPEPYFGSDRTPSPRRLVENVRESSWWTKWLAADMSMVAGALTAVLVITSLLTLVAAANGLASAGAAETAAPWLSAVILLFISRSPFQAWRR